MDGRQATLPTLRTSCSPPHSFLRTPANALALALDLVHALTQAVPIRSEPPHLSPTLRIRLTSTPDINPLTHLLPCSCSLAPTQSMFLDALVSDAAWRGRYARDRDGNPLPFALHEDPTPG